MKLTNSLVNLPQISAAMRDMSMEMTKVPKNLISNLPLLSSDLLLFMKAGIMEDMVEDTLEAIDDDEELEEEADAEVDKVLFELTDGQLGKLGAVGSELPVCPAFSTVPIATSHHVPLTIRLWLTLNRRRPTKLTWSGCRSS
jgi:charged multivesicular body protein 3